MKRIFINFAAALIALPYRYFFASLGHSVRITPPLLMRGAKRIHIGNKVILEHFVGLNVSPGGEIRVGDECELRCFSRLEAHNGTIKLGARCSVNPFTLLSGYGGLTIGEDVRIGSHCAIMSSMHRYESTNLTIREQGVEAKPTLIESDVWLGAGCTVLGGITIGRSSIVGAGAVVTRDVPTKTIATGVPASITGTR